MKIQNRNVFLTFLQTFFILSVIFVGSGGLMAYGSEKMAIAVMLIVFGWLYNKRCVFRNYNYKSAVLLWGMSTVLIVVSYIFSYDRESTTPFIQRFLVLLVMLMFNFQISYTVSLIDYIQKIGTIIAIAYIVTYPFMGIDAGIYDSYQTTGITLSYVSLVAAVKLFDKNSPFIRNLLDFGIIMLAMMMTGKRMLTVIPILILAVVSLFSNNYKKYLKIYIMVIFVVIAGAVIISVNPQLLKMINRLAATAEDTTLSSRTYLWDYAMMLWRKKPVFGIGFGCYATHIRTGGVDMSKYGNIMAISAHNIYFQLLAEVGVVGLAVFGIMFLAFLVYAVYYAIKINKTKDTLLTRVAIMGLIGQLWFLLYGMTGNPLYMDKEIFIYVLSIVMTSSAQREYCLKYDFQSKVAQKVMKKNRK